MIVNVRTTIALRLLTFCCEFKRRYPLSKREIKGGSRLNKERKGFEANGALLVFKDILIFEFVIERLV
jgi:hypothetical protein